MPRPLRRILCVDDNEDTRELLEAYLAGLGYQIVVVATVAEGIRLASTERFDLYLVDTLLPDGSGIDLCRRIRVFDAEAPIVFFSAMARSADRQRGLDAGAQVYLTKPEGLEDLKVVIERLLRGTERPRSQRAGAEERND